MEDEELLEQYLCYLNYVNSVESMVSDTYLIPEVSEEEFMEEQ